MIAKLLLLFILVPLVEISLLIEIGRLIGTLNTLIIVVCTGILGAFLARHQGIGVLYEMRTELANGRLPASQIADGVIILLAGVVLITPGVLTDALGFLCLIPASRKIIKKMLWNWLERALYDGRIHFSSRM
ncbi:FxsA family protein [Candidatus Latescibacterota bacterium]